MDKAINISNKNTIRNKDGYVLITKDDDKIDVDILIGYKNKIYIFNLINKVVNEIEGAGRFISIGIGKPYAEAAMLYIQKFGKDNNAMLSIAESIKVTSELHALVKLPIYIVDNGYNDIYEYNDNSESLTLSGKQIEFV